MNLSFTKILMLVAGLSVSLIASAQQDPHYSNFMHNKLAFNPGFAGNGDKFCATLLHRSQWVGFGGGQEGDVPRGAAPTNLVGSFNAPISKRIGLGVHILRDELGFALATTPTLSLSYKHPFQNEDVLAIGVSAGLMQKSLDGTKLKPLEDGDAKIPNVSVSGTTMDFGAGIYYTRPSLSIFDNFYAGISATHLNQGKVTYEWNGNSRTDDLKMHYYFIAGAEYALNSDFKLQPNLIVKKDPAKIQTDINCFLIWNEKLRGGLTWRPMDAAVVLLGYSIRDNFYLGYSYDLTTSRILKYSSGSHEIVLRYCFGIKITPKINPPVPILTPRFM